MPPKSSAIRSSYSSRRSSPYSRPPALASGRRSPPLPPVSGQHTANRPSENYFSPPSAYHHSSRPTPLLRPSTNSVTGYLPVLPSLTSHPQYAAQLSTSPWVEHSTFHPYSFLQPSAQPLFPQGPYHPLPATNIPHADFSHSLPNLRPPHTAQPSITTCRPDEITYGSYLAHPPQVLQGQAPTQQGQTYYGNDMFKNPHDFTVTNSTFIDHTIMSDNFMEKFLQHTIIGAEFDSSDRHPPPRCHPGTRLAIVERCKIFIVHCNGKEKLRWVVGPAGAGKSAIMQIVTEEIPDNVILGASVFLSVNGRQDATKIFVTIAYQLAAKSEPYRQLIQSEISRDPSLLRKSLPAQFQKFIIDPFILQHLFNLSHRFVIIIDGLDECNNPLAQRELLGLISDFCITYPSSPIAWIVASRPEPHITSFFDDERTVPAYTKEEIKIDSDEACKDVQRYLRDELKDIKLTYPTLRHKKEWPSELEFTKIATAAGGLFAYASTVIRYIGDPHSRNPATQLRHVLESIDATLNDDVIETCHPMAQLDALYQRILSKIPADAMIKVRQLLLVYSNSDFDNGWPRESFRLRCNRLELTEDAAYGAICHLHAVAKVPMPNNADEEDLEYFHKSFPDFLFDFKRSGFSRNIKDEVERLHVQSSVKIVKQGADDLNGMTSGEVIECGEYGCLKNGPDFCDCISLSWSGDDRFPTTDDQLRFNLYCESMDYLCSKFKTLSEPNRKMSCFHVLTTCSAASVSHVPIYELRDSAFEEFRRELTELGKLKQVPLRTLDYAAICGDVNLLFTSPVRTDPAPWNPSCQHIKVDVDSLQQRRGWSTSFERSLYSPGDDVAHSTDIPRFSVRAGEESHWEATGRGGKYKCLYCLRRLALYFINNPNQLATVFVDSTEMCYVEVSIVDPDDGISEWRYRFFHSGPPSCID